MRGVLQHHGILGQRWGIRRFQNKDGSYTDAGKKRRSLAAQQKALNEETFGDRRSNESVQRRANGDLIIKAGTPIYRVSAAENELPSDFMYTTFTKEDGMYYQSNSAYKWLQTAQGKSYDEALNENTYKTGKTLKLASWDTTMAIVIDTAKKDVEASRSIGEKYVTKLLKDASFGAANPGEALAWSRYDDGGLITKRLEKTAEGKKLLSKYDDFEKSSDGKRSDKLAKDMSKAMNALGEYNDASLEYLDPDEYTALTSRKARDKATAKAAVDAALKSVKEKEDLIRWGATSAAERQYERYMDQRENTKTDPYTTVDMWGFMALGGNSYMQNAVRTELKKRGYDGLCDPENRMGTPTKNACILFKEANLKQTSSRKITTMTDTIVGDDSKVSNSLAKINAKLTVETASKYGYYTYMPGTNSEVYVAPDGTITKLSMIDYADSKTKAAYKKFRERYAS